MHLSRIHALSAASLITLLTLCGCGRVSSPQLSATTTRPGLGGSVVHGASSPVAGAVMQLWAVGTSGDRSASTPLLTKVVTTDANGNFTLLNDYTCPAAPAYVYLTRHRRQSGSVW